MSSSIYYLTHFIFILHLAYLLFQSVPENIAAYKATKQSSMIWQGFPQKANDGSRAIYNGDLYFSKTNLYIDEHPWWTVDLLWSRLVDRVHIQTIPCGYELCKYF
jgi:hypothetical protein